MKVFTVIFGLFFALSAAAFKQDPDVFKMVDILYNLNRGAQELNADIVAWRVGNEKDFTTLLALSQQLTAAIWDANTTISGYGGLVETDTLRLEPPVYALTNTVRDLINNLLKKKAAVFAFQDGALAQVVQGEIQHDQWAAGNTSNTIVSKVPEDLRNVARTLAAGIEDNLARGAQIYECANCTSTISGAGTLASGSKAYVFALAALVAAAVAL